MNNWTSGSHSVAPGPAAAAPGSLLETQILGPHPRPEPGIGGGGATIFTSYFNKHPDDSEAWEQLVQTTA